MRKSRVNSKRRTSATNPRPETRLREFVIEHHVGIEDESPRKRRAGEESGQPDPIVLPHLFIGDAILVDPDRNRLRSFGGRSFEVRRKQAAQFLLEEYEARKAYGNRLHPRDQLGGKFTVETPG